MSSLLRSGATKFRTFWTNILSDYNEAFKEVGVRFRERPLKCTLLTGLGAFSLITFHRNPSLHDFLDAHILYNKELTLIPSSIRNPLPEEFHTKVDRLINQKRLRYWDLILFSLIYYEDHSKESGLPAAHVSYLNPSYYEIVSERVIDIGFWGIWWKSRDAMKDFDINPKEWNVDGSPSAPVPL